MLVLRELLGRADDDPEVLELADLRETDPLVVDLLALQEPNGAWMDEGTRLRGSMTRSTAQALMRLGYLGFGASHPAVQRGADWLFAQQQPDGSWPLPRPGREAAEREGYSMVPLQTAMPLRSLAACGYATDQRSERAYGWLLDQQLPDGAWPTGIASGTYGYVAGYRRLAHSRWGCRSNTTGTLICLAHHPRRRTSPQARQALDLLLGRETREKRALGFEVARLVGAEPARGFLTYYARFDVGLVLDLCWRVRAAPDDERVDEMVEFVQGLKGRYGLWDYAARPQASRWVTFDLLRSLSQLTEDQGGVSDWVSLEPRTPFQPYPRREMRY
jgi:hypothetical protein